MSRTSIHWMGGLVLAMGALLAVFIGASLAAMPLPSAVVLMSMSVLGASLVAPWPVLLWALLVVVGFVIGPLQYVGGFSKAFWLPYLMGVLMAARVLSDSLANRYVLMSPGGTPERAAARDQSLQPSASSEDRLMRAALAFAGLFVCALFITMLANRISPLQAMVAGKEYLFLWSLPAAFALGLLNTNHMGLIGKALAVWLSVQLLVVVWQRFLVAPNRGGDAPWDAVVGLFAGRADGAGGSGTMAMVSLWAASCVVMAWRSRLLRWPWMVAAATTALVACGLAEVKVAVLLLPVMAVMVLWAPSRVQSAEQAGVSGRSAGWQRLASFALILCVSALLMWAHQQQFTSSDSVEARSPMRYLETALARNLDARTWADEHGQLTRLGAIQYWWSRQSVSDIPGWLIGHGVGSVRHSNLAPSPFLQGMRFDPGRSSAVILLWEVGVLGLVAWIGTNLSFLLLASRLLRQACALPESVFVRAGAAAIVVTLISLPYGADWFEAPHLAVVHLLGVGWVCAAHRRVGRARQALSFAAFGHEGAK